MVLTWWRSPICLWGQPGAQATFWEVFKKRPADEVYVYL